MGTITHKAGRVAVGKAADVVIKNLDKDLKDVNVSVENYYKEMLESCITGEDKIKFFKAVDDAGISYTLVNAYVTEAVRAAQEKK